MQTYSPFRSSVTFKPRPECPSVDIYQCPHCNRQYQALGPGEHMPAQCCDTVMDRLLPLSDEESPEGYKITYSIVGGLNYDAVRVSWHCPAEVAPTWVLLKTYTGSYIRYLTPKKKAPMVFALADEDAYVYCDKDVCERCTFKCKLGFVIYVCFLHPTPLLLEVPMDKVAPRFKPRIV